MSLFDTANQRLLSRGQLPDAVANRVSYPLAIDQRLPALILASDLGTLVLPLT